MRKIALFIVLGILAFPHLASAQMHYRLGAQDKLRVYVHEWPALTGEFTIGATGRLALPLLGEIPAAGLQTSELAAEISNRLQAKAELRGAPDATVDVVQYRPFYILGAVERPGEYAYRPGMTVLNALSIAGGVYRAREAAGWTFERDMITGAGDARVLALRQEELQAREIRLKAEAEGQTKLTFPARNPNARENTAAAAFAAQEQAVFQARLEKFQNEVQTAQQTIGLYEKEIHSLQAQIATEQKQAKAVEKELEELRTLVSRGLAPAPRVLPLERTYAQIEREQRELETSIIRARQQINQTQQKIATLQDERRSGATAELQAVQSQLKEVAQRYATAQRLLAGATIGAPHSENSRLEDRLPTLIYAIVRASGDDTREDVVTETTRLEPGDIVKVRVRQDNEPDRTPAAEMTTGAASNLGKQPATRAPAR